MELPSTPTLWAVRARPLAASSESAIWPDCGLKAFHFSQADQPLDSGSPPCSPTRDWPMLLGVRPSTDPKLLSARHCRWRPDGRRERRTMRVVLQADDAVHVIPRQVRLSSPLIPGRSSAEQGRNRCGRGSQQYECAPSTPSSRIPRNDDHCRSELNTK